LRFPLHKKGIKPKEYIKVIVAICDMIDIEQMKKLKTKNPIIILGFPGTGLVGSVAATQLVEVLDLEFIGYITSPEFAPLAAIHEYMPLPAARIHYSEKYNLMVILSEMSIPVASSQELAQKILEYVKKIGAQEIITLGGISMHEGPDLVYAISTDKKVTNEIIKNNIAKPIKEGATTGVTGILLALGTVLKFPMVSFLAEASEDHLDPKAASNVLKALEKKLGIKIDTKILDDEAKDLEKELRGKMVKSKVAIKKPIGSMYG